ncbi:hypothetical protein ACT9XH_02835 [Methanococcoides methylutens]|uniref:hypothetical protein n=1 Tax=Methanococcoides methylutens TaxID=2226 RepID=UPI00404435AF
MEDILFETHQGLKSAKKAASHEIDGFMDSVYFKEEVLKKYEGDVNYQIGDNGTVQFGYEWGTFRGCYRVADGIICVNLGDLGEGFPDEELKHWKLYNVHPDDVNITSYYTDFRDTINRLVHFMEISNTQVKTKIKLYYPEATHFNTDSFDDNLFDLKHADHHLRFLKKVINESTSAEELEMKIVTLNCLVIDSINTKLLSKLLDRLDGNLKYASSALTLISVKPDGLNNKTSHHYDSFIYPLRSLELLKRFLLVDDFHKQYYGQEVMTIHDFNSSRDEFHENIRMNFDDLYNWEVNEEDFPNRKYFEHKIADISEKTSYLKLLNKFRNKTAAHGHSPKNIQKMNKDLGLEETNHNYYELFKELLYRVCLDIEKIPFEISYSILIREYYNEWFNDALNNLTNKKEYGVHFEEMLSLLEYIPELFDEFEQQLIEIANHKITDDDFICHFGTFIGKISSQIKDSAQDYIDYLILKYKIDPISMWHDCFNIIEYSNKLNDDFMEKIYPLLKDSIISINSNEAYFSQSVVELIIEKDSSKINVDEIKHILIDNKIYFDQLQIS